MRTVRGIPQMQRLTRQWRQSGRRVGLVPTMGCLHAGHLSLAKRARSLVGPSGKVVVSIYVNPTQFGPGEDLARYPRDLPRDTRLCRSAGVDVVFAPSDGEMYPRGAKEAAFSTYVVEESLSQGMEGASRPTHFRGVATVVAKLFNIVQPGVAVFGQKDFQQAAVIRRMARDLNFPVRIVVAPTLREPDGVAMSSRNQYLSPEERSQAGALWGAIQLAQSAVRSSKIPIAAEELRARLAEHIQQQPAARVDYIAFFDPSSLKPVSTVRRGAQVALAVRVGKTRLIDNAQL